jgi:hypothetical protein
MIIFFKKWIRRMVKPNLKKVNNDSNLRMDRVLNFSAL